MKYSRCYGISTPENGWVPAPRYILRRKILLDVLSKYQSGKVLEIGSGSGALLYDLSKKGFYGYGVEESEQALKVASKVLSHIRTFDIVNHLPEEKKRTFDYLLSFEVLEHIKDDIPILKDWVDYLKPSGIVIISVPAHMTKWGERDIWAGHYRRYERDELKQKIKDSGLKINRIFNYGWPISVLLKSLRENVYRRKNRKQEGIFSDSDRTYRSGIERSTELKTFPLYDNFLGRLFFSVLYVFQKLFFNFEWGDGYIVIAHKKLNDSIIG